MRLYLNTAATLAATPTPSSLARALEALAPAADKPETLRQLAVLAESHPHLRSSIIDEAEDLAAVVYADEYAERGGPAPVVNLAVSSSIWLDDVEVTADGARETQCLLRAMGLCATTGWAKTAEGVVKRLAEQELAARLGRTTTLSPVLDEAQVVADKGPDAVGLERAKQALEQARKAFGLPA